MKNNCCDNSSNKNQEIRNLTEFFKIISNINRFRIMCLLEKKSFCVCEIFQILQLSQNLTSHHLNKLEKFSLIEKNKKGTFVFYKINNKNIGKYKKIFNQIFKIDE